jgi:hypothetical protein
LGFFVFFLYLQCVHRQPKECKERHKVLLDRSSGDGADSAEDSGSSQHYHNTLPGIPKACSSAILFCGYSLLPAMYVGCNSNRYNIEPLIFSSCHAFLKIESAFINTIIMSEIYLEVRITEYILLSLLTFLTWVFVCSSG